jgi:sarcosine oxidase
MQTYDVIVIGAGGMGSAALYHLAGRGVRVLGLEQFGMAHDRGSSHGGTRICRRAYFEHPDYVPLVDRSCELWSQLESIRRQTLFHRIGLVLFAPPDGVVGPGVKRAARQHGFRLEIVPREEWARRFEPFCVPEPLEALYEPDAGYLAVEACVRAHLEEAIRSGAAIRFGATVRRWSADSQGIAVETDQGRYLAGRLVICAGPWSAAVLADLKLPLQVRRKVVLWFRSDEPALRVEAGCPVFAFDLGDRFFYGFPAIGEPAVKVAQHFGGDVVAEASAVDRGLTEQDVQQVWSDAGRYLCGLAPEVVRHSVCMYTMTPDEHFIVDHHPKHANVTFAAGFSGHGFKFAPVIGSALADLTLDGHTSEPIAFLSAKRLS